MWGWGGSCLVLALCFLDSTAEVSMTHRDTADALMGNTAGGNKADWSFKDALNHLDANAVSLLQLVSRVPPLQLMSNFPFSRQTSSGGLICPRAKTPIFYKLSHVRSRNVLSAISSSWLWDNLCSCGTFSKRMVQRVFEDWVNITSRASFNRPPMFSDVLCADCWGEQTELQLVVEDSWHVRWVRGSSNSPNHRSECWQREDKVLKQRVMKTSRNKHNLHSTLLNYTNTVCLLAMKCVFKTYSKYTHQKQVEPT